MPSHWSFAATSVAVDDSTQVDLGWLNADLTRIINEPWDTPLFGVQLNRVIGSARRVRLERLDNEDKVRVTADEVQFDDEYFRSTISSMGATDVCRALCTLYFLHELIHLWQGIGEMSAVRALRSTGAEMTLMHLDLAADHTAVLFANHAVPKWDVLWLKDVQSRALSAFPASSFHTQAARHRKAVRLVSIRLDFLARRDGKVPMHKVQPGYVFADYGFGGGKALVMAMGPPPMMFSSADIDTSKAALLLSAADEHADPDRFLNKLDDALSAILKG